MIVGILGGGQLGRMLALAGYDLGWRFRCLDPSAEAPMGHLADLVVGAYDDPDTLRHFAAGLDLVTYEFENVPVESARLLQRYVAVFPPPEALEAAQDRLHEKRLFQRLNIPTAPFLPVESAAELTAAVEHIGLPAVLKTRRFGYDGKGQFVLRTTADIERAWAEMGGPARILEGFVPFDRELSLLAVRGRGGETAWYPLVENEHRAGILRRSVAPAPRLSPEIQAQAEGYALGLLDALNYAGVLAIELFQVGDQLIANEIAPRVHNSGHWTLEGAETSQFANHLRAVLGLPLGSTAVRGHAAMINIIGTLPDPAGVLAIPATYLHEYGKKPRPGRKLGHATVLAKDQQTLATRMEQLGRLIP